MNSSAKRITINTIIIYIRLAFVTIVSLFTTRYILQILGQSDYGLFNVVGSVITMLNCLSAAMYTTTRRYINIEAGKRNSNLNKIFNISLIIHIGFALFILLICESVGVWYINNYLNVTPEKLPDARFIFQITTIVSCIGIINVPYQSLIEAFEKFWQTAIIDIITTTLKFAFVIMLIFYKGDNALRLYAIMLSGLTLISFLLYSLFCYKQWKHIIKFKFYSEKNIYKEILIFNNYTALGAFSYLGRSQGANILVNIFFGTIVNAAFAIAYQIQNFVQLFIGNLGAASAPQITKHYSSGNLEEAFALCSKINRYTILIMTAIFSLLFVQLEYILELWLNKVPEGCLILCQWILITALISSFSTALPTYIQATGKIKWFQIIGSIVEISLLPIAFIFFKLGYPPVTIIIILATITAFNNFLSLILLRIILNFQSFKFITLSYIRPILVIGFAVGGIFIIQNYIHIHPILSIMSTGILILLFIWTLGITHNERHLISNKIANFVIHKL